MSRADAPAIVVKEGWMEKKGKSRWFVLVGRNLYWFKHEPPVASSESFMKRKCQNHRVIGPDTVVTRVAPKNAGDLNTYALSVESSAKKEKKYVCIASSHADLMHWIAVLSDASKLDGTAAASSGGAASTTIAGGGAGGAGGAGGPTYMTSPMPADQLTAFNAALLEDPNFYDGDTNLMTYAWFHGTMSSDEAFRVLETQPVGAYLVRVSAQRPACFVISFVADSDKVIHVVWEWNDTLGWTAEGRPDGFDTIKDILLAFKQVYNLAVLRP